MKIVVDANIVIAAILGSRATIIILTSQNHTFYAPHKIMKEIVMHKEKICQESHLSIEDFEDGCRAVNAFIHTISPIEYEQYMRVANLELGARDISDADYLACALAIHADFIWTLDKDFLSQSRIPVKTTQEFIDEQK